MTKEEYLELIQKLDLLILNELEELEKLNTIAAKVTQANDGMPHAPGASDKVGNGAIKIIEKQKEIDEIISLSIDLRKEIIGQIRKLHKDEYDVLYKYYVLEMSIFDIADVRKKSETWVKEMKRKGINNIEIQYTDTFFKIIKLVTKSGRK